jgi:hypothetical protein
MTMSGRTVQPSAEDNMVTTGVTGAALVLSAVAGACDGRPRVEMSLEWQARSIPEQLRDIAQTEVAVIWERLGVTVQWIEPRSNGGPIVRAIVSDEAGRTMPPRPTGSAALPHLGWIEFWGNTPSNVVRVSAGAALEAARDARTQDRMASGHPLAALRIIAARLVGRAIAHELGHYLLRSRRHTSNGLMRPVFPAYEGLLPLLDRYRLERRLLDIVRANGRPAACRQQVSGWPSVAPGPRW